MASGDTLAVFDALSARSPATNHASIDFRNDHAVLDFDDAVSKSAHFQLAAPAGYSGGALQMRVVWAAGSATTGDTVWGVKADCLAPGSGALDAAGAGIELTTAAAPAATVGVLAVTTIDIAAADAGTPAPGDLVRITVRRDAAAIGDTMVGDAELVSLEVREV